MPHTAFVCRKRHGPSEVVEAFPVSECFVEIDIVHLVEKRVELLLIGAVRAFDFTVQLRRTRFDIDVPHAFVFDVPVKLGLELVPPVRSDTLQTKREGDQYMIDEFDRVLLRGADRSSGPGFGLRGQWRCMDTV